MKIIFSWLESIFEFELDFELNFELINRWGTLGHSVPPATIGFRQSINYFADLRMTFRQNFFLQDWFRNKFGVGLG
jgi:hypothetical protein